MRFFAFLAVIVNFIITPHNQVLAGPNTFNADGIQTRNDANSNSLPDTAVGYLQWTGGNRTGQFVYGHCTATLVSRDIILTAAHCLVGENGGEYRSEVRFYPHWPWSKNPQFAIAQPLIVGTPWDTSPKLDRQNDWGFLRLNVPLGDAYGWLEVKAIDIKEKFNQPIFSSIGYNDDWRDGNSPSKAEHCKFTNTYTGFFLNNCDMTDGGSGGPIYYKENDGHYYIAAIFAAAGLAGWRQGDVAYADATANVGVSAEKFTATLSKLFGKPTPTPLVSDRMDVPKGTTITLESNLNFPATKQWVFLKDGKQFNDYHPSWGNNWCNISVRQISLKDRRITTRAMAIDGITMNPTAESEDFWVLHIRVNDADVDDVTCTYPKGKLTNEILAEALRIGAMMLTIPNSEKKMALRREEISKKIKFAYSLHFKD